MKLEQIANYKWNVIKKGVIVERVDFKGRNDMVFSPFESWDSVFTPQDLRFLAKTMAQLGKVTN